jgi:putative hydrolase of the HAD superfamily
MPRLKALTFDLWDTLIQEIPRKNPALGKARVKEMHSKLRFLGFDYELDSLDRAYKQSGDFCDEIWSRGKDLPVDDHLLFMLNCIDPKLRSELGKRKYEEIREIYIGTLLRHQPVLMEDVASTLHYLEGKGYRIGMISNTGRTPGDILKVVLANLGIDRYFNHMTFSNEVLIRKPDREIFLHTLKKMHTAPKNAMHIGDDLYADYEGARAVGMKAILLDRENEHEPMKDRIQTLAGLLEIL